MLADYNSVLPGLADRIVKMAEVEQNHAHRMQRWFAVLPFTGQGAAFLIALAGLAVGGLLGSVTTKRITGRIGTGMAYVAGAFGFTAPLAPAPLASLCPGHASGGPLVLMVLFCGEFLCGFGMMVLDISIGAIFASVIPDDIRSRVSGAFSAVNYGARPIGALLGGFLGSSLGLVPTLWIAVAGGVFGAALMVPSPLPRFRLQPTQH